MAYEFKTLGSVEALTEVPENAHALVEVDGAIKRVPGGALGGSAGGSGDWDAVIVDNSGALYYSGLSNIDVSSLQFSKGSLNELYNMMMQGQSPKVCLSSLVNLSYGGTQYAQIAPLSISTFYYSGGQGIVFQFIEYMNNGTLSHIAIEANVTDNVFSNIYKTVIVGGEPN